MKGRFNMKSKKIISIILVIAAILTCACFTASAKSLKDCFTSGSQKWAVSQSIANENTWYKKSWAKTEGYGSPHYLRCYVGKNMLGDTKRRDSQYPHMAHSIQSTAVNIGTGFWGSLGIGYTAYAFYGV